MNAELVLKDLLLSAEHMMMDFTNTPLLYVRSLYDDSKLIKYEGVTSQGSHQ